MPRYRCLRCSATLSATSRAQLPESQCAGGTANRPYHEWQRTTATA